MIAERFRSRWPGASRDDRGDQAPAATDSLAELADALVRLSDRHASTPAVVTPTYLSLRPPFFVALADQIHSRSGRWPQFDWHRHTGALAASLTDRWARRRAATINRALAAAGLAGTDSDGDRSEIALTAMIRRPGGADRTLVVGWCDEGTELPGWVTPIYLSGAAVG